MRGPFGVCPYAVCHAASGTFCDKLPSDSLWAPRPPPDDRVSAVPTSL